MIRNPSQADAPAQGGVTPGASTLKFTLLFCGLLAVTFPLVVTGVTAFVFGDMGQFAYPVAYYGSECLRNGELPLWNPYNSCGIPFLAQWNTMVLYPLSLVYVALPMPWSFGVFCLLHLVIAAAGMHKLARHFAGSSLAAICAGVVYGFNGFTWYGIMWPHLLSALAWAPWLISACNNAHKDVGGVGRFS